jgi:hypothetical protein
MIWRTLVMAVLTLAVALSTAPPAQAQKKRQAMGCTASAPSHYAYCVGKAAHPHVPWVKVPAGSIKGMGEFWTTAIIVGFAVPKIVKAVSEGIEHQKAAFKGTTDDISKLTVDSAQSPLHAGAIKYFREKGIKIPDNLIPAEAK